MAVGAWGRERSDSVQLSWNLINFVSRVAPHYSQLPYSNCSAWAASVAALASAYSSKALGDRRWFPSRGVQLSPGCLTALARSQYHSRPSV